MQWTHPQPKTALQPPTVRAGPFESFTAPETTPVEEARKSLRGVRAELGRRASVAFRSGRRCEWQANRITWQPHHGNSQILGDAGAGAIPRFNITQ
jgi:hypothetical protein